MIAFEKKSPLILISAAAVNVTFVKKHSEASSLLSLLLLLSLWLSSSLLWLSLLLLSLLSLSSSSLLLLYYYYYYYHYYDHHHYYYHSINNIPYQCDINCAGHFTLDALASRPVACRFLWGVTCVSLYQSIKIKPTNIYPGVSSPEGNHSSSQLRVGSLLYRVCDTIRTVPVRFWRTGHGLVVWTLGKLAGGGVALRLWGPRSNVGSSTWSNALITGIYLVPI